MGSKRDTSEQTIKKLRQAEMAIAGGAAIS
jgi:hypothetical protein